MSTSLTSLLQIVDSAFPTGAFAHSFGLETYVQCGVVHDSATFAEFARTTLIQGIGQMDAVAVSVCHRACVVEDLSTVVRADELLSAAKVAEEPRMASVRIGRQLLRTCREVFPHWLLERLGTAVEDRAVEGHHAAVFGLATSTLGIDRLDALIGFLHAHVLSQASAAVRLVPLGATAAQRVAHSLAEDVVRVAVKAECACLDDLGGFTPGLDIRAMQHARLESRLFMS